MPDLGKEISKVLVVLPKGAKKDNLTPHTISLSRSHAAGETDFPRSYCNNRCARERYLLRVP